MSELLIAIRDAVLAILLSWGGMEFDRSEKAEEAREARSILVRLAAKQMPDCQQGGSRLDTI
jgi:hypothetical protein